MRSPTCGALAISCCLAWLGLILVLGLFLTNKPHLWPRLLGLLPPVALLAGLALERLYTPAVDWAKQRQVSWVRPAIFVPFLPVYPRLA